MVQMTETEWVVVSVLLTPGILYCKIVLQRRAERNSNKRRATKGAKGNGE